MVAGHLSELPQSGVTLQAWIKSWLGMGKGMNRTKDMDAMPDFFCGFSIFRNYKYLPTINMLWFQSD